MRTSVLGAKQPANDLRQGGVAPPALAAYASLGSLSTRLSLVLPSPFAELVRNSLLRAPDFGLSCLFLLGRYSVM